eukprot:8831210-Ditylum_brightwellii.AAC.1
MSCEDIVDILEDGILYQWKLEFKKEGFDSIFSMLKEFLDVCTSRRIRAAEAAWEKVVHARTKSWNSVFIQEIRPVETSSYKGTRNNHFLVNPEVLELVPVPGLLVIRHLLRTEHDKDGKGKHQDKPKLRYKGCHSSAKCRQGKRKKKIATIMVCVIMTWMSATLCKPTESTFSLCTASQNSRGSSRSSLSRMPKGQPKSAA